MSFGSQAWGWKQQGSPQLEARYTLGHYAGFIAIAIALGSLAALCGFAFLESHVPGFLVVSLPLAVLALWLFLSRLYLLVCGEPGLLLDADGLRHPILGAVHWRDVLGLQLQCGAKGARYLEICLAPGVGMQGGVWWMRLPQRNTRVIIPLQGLDEPWNVIDVAANTLRDQVAPPRLASWLPGLDRETVDTMWEGQQLCAQLQALSPSQTAQGQSLLAALNANTGRLKGLAQRLQSGQERQSAKTLLSVIAVVMLLVAFRLLLF